LEEEEDWMFRAADLTLHNAYLERVTEERLP